MPPSRLSPRAALDLANATADQRIQIYEATLKTKPDNLPAEIGLTSACLQKLRESGDGAYLDRAAKLVDTMLRQDGGSLISLRLQNEVDLQRHEFKAVADRSRDLIRFSPSDPGVWANLGDASMELGAYDDAGKAYLKMFALRPNLASYNRLAYFRFVTGDVPNAIFLMKSAVESGDSQPENIAWSLAELGDMYFKTGSIEEAQRAFRSAIDIFPTLHRALAGLGRIAASEKQFDVAIAYYKRAQSIVPLVEYAFVLEDLYTAAGQPGRAREQQSLVDVIEQLGAVKNERTNRNLA
ncbi:MAG: tetratricopeptide repeat protein, partial [Acidobacteriaceae bacterium]|nr:tetratricopeptide repeat protein [Acidobacteriaceae bacterium]